jgi:hypothetical protein
MSLVCIYNDAKFRFLGSELCIPGLDRWRNVVKASVLAVAMRGVGYAAA